MFYPDNLKNSTKSKIAVVTYKILRKKFNAKRHDLKHNKLQIR